MNILITAPSFDATKNVSGVVAVSKTIIDNNKLHTYHHYLMGSPDIRESKIVWASKLLKQILVFPFFVKNRRIELVHQNLPFEGKGVIREYIINLWCWILRVPVVLHVHGGSYLMNGPSNFLMKYFSDSLFKKSKKVVVLSELEKEALQNHSGVMAAIVLSNCVNLKEFEPKTKNIDHAKPTFLFLGRIIERKGIEDIIDALSILKQQKKEFRFIVCGSGDLQNQLNEKCTALLGVDFEFRGVVAGKNKIELFKECHFLLLPSRYGEGLPMALLETMAAGMVPVVTDDASMKYLVHHHQNGIRVNKYDAPDMADKIAEILDNRVLYNSLSSRAIETIKLNYDISAYISKLNLIYDSALSKRK